MNKRRRLAAAALGLGLCLPLPAAFASQNLVFTSGAFRRSIPVADLDHLATTGEARGLLRDVLRLSRQNPKDVSRLLNESVQLPIVLMSRLLNTRIGEAILARLARILFPLRAPEAGLPALRSAMVLGTYQNNGALSAISFLKAYPTQELEVSLPALMGLLSKAASIGELVRFFSESPLDGLRGNSAEAAPAAPAPKTPAP
ncbi:MAG: hypothetical protein ER33_06050 [Cyanobium sp. CACIAM 14]|nr:MAG: hypothetical protein ER33_06050 [Cyanobium sp. CACIAM 14]